jgi:hypothetical protein
MSVGGVGYYLCLPRDAAFGLPDRIYYEDKTDDEIAALKRDGKLTSSKIPHPATGQLIYAEGADVWKARRKEAAKRQCISGTSLFNVRAYPRDMVLRELDDDGVKWACIIEEIPGTALGEGSELAISAARQGNATDKGRVPEDDVALFGLFKDEKGQIVGGVGHGGPLHTMWNRDGIFTLLKFFNRTEQVILVASQGNIDGAREIYRGRHGCTVAGVPTCPVVEVPFMRTDVDSPGMEFSTPLSQVFGIAPPMNQILTLASNATVYNELPRWVIELKDGSVLRGADGEPVTISQADVPGLDPKEATAWPGTLKQLTIDTASGEKMFEIYTALMEKYMPSPVTAGVSGTNSAAWQVRQLIQQAQETLRQPVDNHAAAVGDIIKMMHGWLRDLDVPVFFFAAPGHRKNKRSVRGLIEFDPKNLTDSIMVTQELDSPEEQTVRIQVGIEQYQAGLITLEDYYRDYAKTEDPRQSVIDYYVAQVVAYVMSGKLPEGANPQNPTQPVIQIVADGVRGMVNYSLLQQSPNYAIAQAEQIAAQAQQQGQQQPQGGNVAGAQGVVQPGLGMSPTLNGQLGANPALGTTGPVGGPIPTNRQELATDRTQQGAIGMGVGGPA